VKIPTDAFNARSIEFNLAPNSSIVVNRTRRGDLPQGYIWGGEGKSSNEDKDTTIAQMVARNGKCYGRIVYRDQVYSIQPLDNGIHVLVKRDLSKLPPDHPPSFEEIEREEKPMAEPNPDDAQPDTARYAALTEIDVMIVYTQAVKDKQGKNLGAHLTSLVDVTNDTFTTSEIPNLRLRLSDWRMVDYTESGSLKADLNALRFRNDGVMDEVHERRDDHAADVVVMLVTKGDGCGFAAEINAGVEKAFAVVLDDAARENYTFAHEIGHLLGARHDPAADPKGKPYPYGHGFKNCAKEFRTIMAVPSKADTDPCVRIGYWSNPSVLYKGHPTGTEECNDAKVLRDGETANKISKFRPKVP
jgi:hypothetical protein